ncbi:hypothetical protein PHYBLDRAFT_163693 [Phycomyces blakesleeanus NRRL 1555(-)]|uniref:Uncharacterized protein n=1 Tax=Phycomyces blakesleeanus (strain ATCC 8743b / DSM 1359 / FGSC 10004 / NBRC 33097 / NRRL 1555) TaxID=763407 RepID=A0A162UXA9_PHYB8|nr:hypothetical protein PHYBLDRAFT_163693 [Phycomyces blakesleeanus NRRL 1555(-)]OAD78592.1 hypothetical protein PHYBLDRAFT_163693 [Phycomyces blakesleeanus NRRL 1555(-)]|eukprot:XP_018296632.1 hypothetical protein PHYBLDRAFT_163693 [Phycomyces blakesleeanus NRRL 1555(-)]
MSFSFLHQLIFPEFDSTNCLLDTQSIEVKIFKRWWIIYAIDVEWIYFMRRIHLKQVAISTRDVKDDVKTLAKLKKKTFMATPKLKAFGVDRLKVQKKGQEKEKFKVVLIIPSLSLSENVLLRVFLYLSLYGTSL